MSPWLRQDVGEILRVIPSVPRAFDLRVDLGRHDEQAFGKVARGVFLYENVEREAPGEPYR